MQKSTLVIASILAFATPVAGHAGEVVEFAFKKGELSSAAKRELLLERIEAHSEDLCNEGTGFTTRSSVKSCANDLRSQFIRAIDNPELSLLAATDQKARHRSAMR